MRNYFKVNIKNEDTTLLDSIFDFVVIGIVAIIFSSFGKSLVNHNQENIIFAIANIILLSTTWYSYTFYSIRYQKQTIFYVLILVPILFTLILYGIGIKSFFTSHLNQSQNMLLIGYVLSRILIAIVFLIIYFSNSNIGVKKTTIWKALSRLINVVVVVLNYFYNFIDLKYLFLILALIEVLGNIININKKYLSLLPKLDIKFTQARFTKLNSLYIGSFLVASINFYSMFVANFDFWYIISHLGTFILIGILLWIIYYQRIIKFSLLNQPKTIILFASLAIIIDIGISIIGSVFLYIDDFLNLDSKVPLQGLLMFIIGLLIFLFSAKFECSRKSIKNYKIFEYSFYILIILFFMFFTKNLTISLIVLTIILISLIINYYIYNYIVKKYNN